MSSRERETTNTRTPTIKKGTRGGSYYVAPSSLTSRIMSRSSSSDPQEPLQFATKCIKSVGDDCLIFHCVAVYKDQYKVNRNMIVLKTLMVDEDSGEEDYSLSLINPLILSEDGEDALLQQGSIDNIVRLGASVGMYDGAAEEDMYYLSKFPDCQRWAPGTISSCRELPVDRLLKNKRDPDMFHHDCRCFVLRSTREPEALLLLNREKRGNILIAGDCIQYQIDNPFTNPPMMARHKMAGLLKATVVVSKSWLNANVSPHKGGLDGIQHSLETMTRAKFDRFISTSGNKLLKHPDTKQNIVDAVQKAFVVQSKPLRQRRAQSLVNLAQTTHY